MERDALVGDVVVVAAITETTIISSTARSAWVKVTMPPHAENVILGSLMLPTWTRPSPLVLLIMDTTLIGIRTSALQLI